MPKQYTEIFFSKAKIENFIGKIFDIGLVFIMAGSAYAVIQIARFLQVWLCCYLDKTTKHLKKLND